MKIKVLFWNVWLDNQINGESESNKLIDELSSLIEELNPDIIGLNEVLQNVNENTPFIYRHLNKLGYKYNYFAPASPFTDEWLIGAGMASKIKPDEQNNIIISNDSPAAKRGYENHKVKAIAASFSLNNSHFNLIVAHPIHLQSYTLKDHFQATDKLLELVQSKEYANNTILGGDFNEPLMMPASFRGKSRSILNSRSGTILNPTWTLNAGKYTPIRANLDQIYWTKKGKVDLSSFKVIRSNVSDHKPLFATFEIKQ